MQPLKARVENGRYVIDEKAELPDGTELYLIPANEQSDRLLMEDDGLTDEEREEVSAMIEESFEDEAAGRMKDFSEVLATLRTES
jgi:hypothetical protein